MKIFLAVSRLVIGLNCVVFMNCTIVEQCTCDVCLCEECNCQDGSCPADAGNEDLASSDEAGSETPSFDGAENTETIEPDIPPAKMCLDDGSEEVAVVVIVNNYSNYDDGYIGLFALNASGRLRDTGIQVRPVNRPKAISLRPDGKEVMVSWGNSSEGMKHGFTVAAIESNPLNLSLVQSTDLDGQFGPLAVSYTSNDSAIVSRTGPGVNNLVPLVRQGDNTFSPGTPFEVPTGFPRNVAPIPGQEGHELFLQAGLSSNDGSVVYPITDIGGTITVEADSIFLQDTPWFLYMNPVTARAYLPTFNPNDDGSDPINPTGLMHVLSPGDFPGWTLEPVPFILPDIASLAAFPPSGKTMVFTDEVQELIWDPESGGCIKVTDSWELYPVHFSDDGLPVSGGEPLALVDAYMVFDIKVSHQDQIVLSRVWSDEKANDIYDIVSAVQDSAGHWIVCDPIASEGDAELVVAPPLP